MCLYHYFFPAGLDRVSKCQMQTQLYTYSVGFLGFFFWANKSRKLQKAGYPVFETSIRIVIAEGAQRAEKTVPVPGTPCPVECSKPFEAVMAYSSGLL